MKYSSLLPFFFLYYQIIAYMVMCIISAVCAGSEMIYDSTAASISAHLEGDYCGYYNPYDLYYPYSYHTGGCSRVSIFLSMRDKSQNFISKLLPDSSCSASKLQNDIWYARGAALFGVQNPLFPWEIPLFSIDFWQFQWAISPLLPWQLVAHFVRTGLL